MKHPVRFTYLGFHFNSLVDSGNFLDLKETHNEIRKKAIFPWLKEKLNDRVDISLFTPHEINEIEEFFESLSCAVDEERKMGVSKNGLCLLVAYCLEGAQRKVSDF